jgi:hypothetical protein
MGRKQNRNLANSNLSTVLSILRYDYYNRKLPTIVALIIIGFLIVDAILSSFFDVFEKQLKSNLGLLFFIVAIAVTYGLGQYFFLFGILKRLSLELTVKTRYFALIYKMVRAVLYALTAIFVFIILQMVFTSHYHVGSTIAATILSYSLACIISSIFTYKLFSWNKSRKDIMVFLYGLAASMLAIGIVSIAIIQVSLLSNNKSQIIGPELEAVLFDITPMSAGVLGMIQNMANLIGYGSVWTATAILMLHYSRKLGRIKYWTIIGLPLAAFLAGVIPGIVIQSNDPLFYEQNVFYFRILLKVGLLGQGIFFGVAYLTVARNIGKINQTRGDYLALTAFGLILVAVSLAPVESGTLASYPPFGVAASSFFVLSAYLLMVGVYSSAIFVSEDAKLRKALRKFAVNEFKFLDSIGTAQMEQEIERRVESIVMEQQETITKQTGIQPSFTEDDMKEYLDEVLKEVSKNKNNH